MKRHLTTILESGWSGFLAPLKSLQEYFFLLGLSLLFSMPLNACLARSLHSSLSLFLSFSRLLCIFLSSPSPSPSISIYLSLHGCPFFHVSRRPVVTPLIFFIVADFINYRHVDRSQSSHQECRYVRRYAAGCSRLCNPSPREIQH